MSRQTMQAVEDAITAHLRADAAENNADTDEGSVVIDWVVGVTFSKIDEENEVVYRNAQFGPPNNPNGQSALHAWASAEIMEAMAWNSGDDDD